METRDRSIYPDSPHPGHWHPSDWIAKPYSIVFTAVVFFILIFGIAIFLGYRQFETTRHNALTADKTTASLLADLMLEHNKAAMGILQSYAHRPLFIDAVKSKNLAGAYRHLSDLKKNAEIDLTFVTDTRGILWANFPVFPEAIGNDLSNRDWYKGISSRWRPYISNVFKLIVGDKPLAVAICVPIFDEKEKVIGILGNSERLGFIDAAIERVPFSPYTIVNVIDRAGQILYSNKVPYQENITDYRFFPILEAAVKEKKQQIEMNDPQKDQEKRYLTVVPMGDIGWTVIIERSLKDIYRSEFRRFIEIGAVSCLLFLSIIFSLIYLRKVSLFRKTEELLQAETKLRESEELFSSYLENAPDGVYLSDLEGNFLYGNLKCEEIIGYRREELIGKNFLELNILSENSLDKAVRLVQANTEGGSTGPDEIDLINKEGRLIPVEINTSVVRRMGQRIVLAFVRDITDRKRAEEVLRESEEKYRWVLDNITDVITVMDMNLRFTYVSPSIMRMRGYTDEEAMAQTFEQVMTPESLQISAKVFEEEMKLEASGTADPGRSRILELEQYRKDGSIVCMENSLSFMRDTAQKPVGIISVSRDITDRKRAEEALRESEELFRRYLEYAPDGVYMSDLEGNFLYGNRKCEEIIGYRREELIGKNFLELNILSENSLNKAVRLLQANMEGKSTGPDEIELITKEGRFIPVEINTSVFQRMGQRIVLAFVRDITERKKAEEELLRTLESLRKAFGATVQVMVSAVESRDPYTAGHQIRSADLARAIATEMGLPQEKIDGIRMAGSIHDIGKLSVPAEILSKPKKLTEIEFSLIKEHSRSGYEILKDVESPWPLADIVYQHHERMNGSGYPRALKGEEILMEGRILAVADVVESMASHRPYRAALGLNVALEEIEKNRGTLYDEAVVDACLRLFREKEYRFAEG